MSDNEEESNVVRLPGADWITPPPLRSETICSFDEVVGGAKEAGVERIILVGVDEDGDMYFASNIMQPPDIHYLLSKASNVIVSMKSSR